MIWFFKELFDFIVFYMEMLISFSIFQMYEFINNKRIIESRLILESQVVSRKKVEIYDRKEELELNLYKDGRV